MQCFQALNHGGISVRSQVLISLDLLVVHLNSLLPLAILAVLNNSVHFVQAIQLPVLMMQVVDCSLYICMGLIQPLVHRSTSKHSSIGAGAVCGHCLSILRSRRSGPSKWMCRPVASASEAVDMADRGTTDVLRFLHFAIHLHRATAGLHVPQNC